MLLLLVVEFGIVIVFLIVTVTDSFSLVKLRLFGSLPNRCIILIDILIDMIIYMYIPLVSLFEL